MRTGLMFMDCPSYLDGHGIVRCGLAAEAEDRYKLTSSDRPLGGVRIRCPSGHFFNGATEALILEKHPEAAAA